MVGKWAISGQPKPDINLGCFTKLVWPNNLSTSLAKQTNPISFQAIWIYMETSGLRSYPTFPYKNWARAAAEKQNAPQIFLVMVTHQQGRDDLCLHVEFRDSLCRQTQLVWLLWKNCYLKNKKSIQGGYFFARLQGNLVGIIDFY